MGDGLLRRLACHVTVLALLTICTRCRTYPTNIQRFGSTVRWSGTMPITRGNHTFCATAAGEDSLLPSRPPFTYVNEPRPSNDINVDVFGFWGHGGDIESVFPDVPAVQHCQVGKTSVAPIAPYARAVFVYETMIITD